MAESQQASETSENVAQQADRLISEAKDKRPITIAGMEDASLFAKMTVAAKVELYANRLAKQVCDERDRLLGENRHLREERDGLRESENELAGLRHSLLRDRWEVTVTIIVMAIGGSLISAYPSGTTGDAWGFSATSLFAIGWALILISAIWQVGKTILITIADIAARKRRRKANVHRN